MCLVSTLNAGFRMKEILLDLAEVTAGERPEIDEQLVDFGVVGPGPRRALNFVNNRRWFDNEYDRSPQVFLWGGCHANGRAGHSCAALPMRDFSQAEKLYVDELRAFRTYLQSHTSIRVNYSTHGPPTTEKMFFGPPRAPGPTTTARAHRGEPIPLIPVELRCNRTDFGPQSRFGPCML